MFFIFGISSRRKEFDFSQAKICEVCGVYGRLEAFMTYSYFSVFFIPILKWNKQYYIRSSCCGSIYTVDEEIGKAIKRGEEVKIEDKDLNPVKDADGSFKTCDNCNYPIEDVFEYCPKCGNKL